MLHVVSKLCSIDAGDDFCEAAFAAATKCDLLLLGQETEQKVRLP